MKNSHARIFSMALLAIAFALTSAAYAQYTETMLVSFAGGTGYGYDPEGLARDASGNLYSIVVSPANTNCNKGSCGQIIKLTPDSSGHYTESSIHTFTGGTGGYTPSAIFLDAAGNIYGTADYGGLNGTGCRFGCGIVFELKPLSAGGFAFTVLYSFANSRDGDAPFLTMIDASGNLFGVTNGGITNTGTIFEVSPASGGTWTKTTISNVYGQPLLEDASGNLFGVSGSGGNTTNCTNGCGYVFELTPSTSGTWSESMLWVFNGDPDGANPVTLVSDGAGNLWGTTSAGGTGTNSICVEFTPHGCGTLFELTPNSGGWSETVQHSFNYALDGWLPYALISDGANNLYVDLYEGGVGKYGTILKFAFNASDGLWEYTTLHNFADKQGGGLPFFMTLDPEGNVYGTLLEGGPHNAGGIYRLAPPAATK